MVFFVTGATGFVGGVLVRQLVAAGHRVRAIARDPAKATDLAALGIEISRGDVADRASLRRPMTGADGVFHVAGWYKIGLRDERAAVRTNVEGTRNVLEVMCELGVPKGVYTSTLAVNSDTRGQVVDETYTFHGRYISVYERTKAEAHAIAQSFIDRGTPLVIVQPGLVYGPGDTSSVGTMLVQFLQRRLPAVPSGTAFSWAHVEDIVRGHRLAMERGAPGRSYFLAGPVHTLVDALDIASRLTGVPAPRHVSPRLIGVVARIAGVIERFVSLRPEYTAEGLRTVAGTTYIGSAGRAERELGWTARSLSDGLAETLRHEMRVLEMAASR